MTGNTDVLPDTPTPGSMEHIALQIKSLEQRTTSVTLPRNASVLELKQEIQIAFDVESNRQRLIFQGRVLKDDKNLTDYANLDNGKVIHLVIRPLDVPHNPMNDDPNPGSNIRHAFSGRGTGAGGGRPGSSPGITRRLPMMEGYAFITLDSTFSDLTDNDSLISSVLSSLTANGGSGGLAGLTNRARAAYNTNNASNNPTSNNSNTNTTDSAATNNTRNPTAATPSGGLPRSPFTFTFGRNGASDFTSPLADRASPGVPFPPSVEVRLARTLGSMRNVRAMLEDASTSDDTPTTGFTSTPNSTPEQLHEIRNRLRNNGNNQPAQIGMVLNELADLMTEVAPRMIQVSQSLRRENPTNEEERNTSRRVLNMSRVVQGMSLINHFLGSVLASADIDSRRASNTSSTSTSTSATVPTSTPTLRNARNILSPSYLARGNTESVRTPPPHVEPIATSSSDPSSKTTPKTRSALSNTTTAASISNEGSPSSSSSTSHNHRGSKRRIDQVEPEDEKNGKGKKKDKEE